MHKIGDIVDIYQKPLTKEDYEGKAELVKPAINGDGTLTLWNVRFIDDELDSDVVYQRFILED